MSLPSHEGLLLELQQLRPSRQAVVKRLNELRASLPAPPKGQLVGTNGPDWSFRLSLIENDEFGRRGHFPTYRLLRGLIHPYTLRKLSNGYTFEPFCLFAPHAKLETVRVTKEGILKWTQWARLNGVEHDGKWGYKFPRKRVWSTDAGVFDSIDLISRRPIAKRSITARKERKARRALLVGRAKTSQLTDVLIVCPKVSSHQARYQWYHSNQRISWQEFKRTQNWDLTQKIRTARGCSEPAKLVIDALYRIYSRVSYERIEPNGVHVTVRDSEVVPIPPTAPSRREYLLRRLQRIEENGFKETYEWFYLNHELAKLTD